MTKNFNDGEQIGDIALKEAAKQLSFIASVINDCPDEQFVNNLREHYGNILVANDGIELFLQELAGESNAKAAEELAIDWTRLFRGISPAYGPKPPYAGIFLSYDGTGADVLGYIKRLYNSYRFKRDDGKHDRADYLGFELDFIAHLINQAAIAEEAGNGDTAKQLLEVAKRFMAEYIAPWVNDFINQATEYAKTSFYQSYLELLEEHLHFTSDILQQNLEPSNSK